VECLASLKPLPILGAYACIRGVYESIGVSLICWRRVNNCWCVRMINYLRIYWIRRRRVECMRTLTGATEYVIGLITNYLRIHRRVVYIHYPFIHISYYLLGDKCLRMSVILRRVYINWCNGCYNWIGPQRLTQILQVIHYAVGVCNVLMGKRIRH
jgi:hypothetical protein